MSGRSNGNGLCVNRRLEKLDVMSLGSHATGGCRRSPGGPCDVPSGRMHTLYVSGGGGM